jgi:phage regulator Rha-like protein
MPGHSVDWVAVDIDATIRSTVDIAKVFGKRHADVMRAVRAILESAGTTQNCVEGQIQQVSGGRDRRQVDDHGSE